MIRYFGSLLKKRIPIIIALTALFMIAALVVNNVKPYVLEKYVNGVFSRVPRGGLFIVFTVGLIVLSIAIPLIEFSFKMIRIQAQQAYSFPIKRGMLYLSRYFIGLIEIVVPFAVSYFASALVAAKADNLYDNFYFVLYGPIACGCAILFYTYISFIFCRANNFIDGIAAIILSIITPFVIGMAFVNFMGGVFDFLRPFAYFNPTMPLLVLTEYCEAHLIGEGNRLAVLSIILVSAWVLLEILMIPGMYFFNKKIKSEDITKISDSFLCYNFFSILMGVFGPIALAPFVGGWAPILMIAFTLLLNTLQHRGICFEKKSGLISLIVIGHS